MMVCQVHLFDDMGVSAGAVTKYVDYYLTLVNLDALLVLLVSFAMSGVVREWFCHTLWVGKFTLPASWPTWCCCGVAGTTHSLDKIGSLCSCLGGCRAVVPSRAAGGGGAAAAPF